MDTNTANTTTKNASIDRGTLATAPARFMAHTPKGWEGLTVLQRVEHAARLARAEGMEVGKPTYVGK